MPNEFGKRKYVGPFWRQLKYVRATRVPHNRTSTGTALLPRNPAGSEVAPFADHVPCVHGGAFFEAIGVDFENLDRRQSVINADVLDAWFPPAPEVITQLTEHLPWILRTSPPTQCEGVVSAIAKARGLPAQCIVPGAGSSNLMYLALRKWCTSASRVLILDPMYGEYAHLFDKVIGCSFDRLTLERNDDYRLDLDRLSRRLQRGYDLVVIVNPNNPTGQHIRREELQVLLREAPGRTRFWIDEAYLDYVGADESLEQYAAASRNTVVCKSMSKVYALSGVRAAYLCALPSVARELLAETPPWALGLPAQMAAIAALGNPRYYQQRYRETHALRETLTEDLRSLGNIDVLPGSTNSMLCHLPTSGPDAATIVERCRHDGLFLRDIQPMGSRVGAYVFRIAVKDAETNGRIVTILRNSLRMNGHV